MDDASIDAAVTRSPLGSGWLDPVWHEVYRLLKPGAHILAFGGEAIHKEGMK